LYIFFLSPFALAVIMVMLAGFAPYYHFPSGGLSYLLSLKDITDTTDFIARGSRPLLGEGWS
jgi:hypothetical protein